MSQVTTIPVLIVEANYAEKDACRKALQAAGLEEVKNFLFVQSSEGAVVFLSFNKHQLLAIGNVREADEQPLAELVQKLKKEDPSVTIAKFGGGLQLQIPYHKLIYAEKGNYGPLIEAINSANHPKPKTDQ